MEISKINPRNPNNFLPIEKMYLGMEAELILTSNGLSQRDIDSVRVKCLDFYVKLCTKIRKRVNFDDET
jgi:hypothetical protein